MPQSDGTIIIDTEIKEDGVKAGVDDIKKSLDRMTKKLDEIKSAFDKAFSGDYAQKSVSDQNRIQSEVDQTKRSVDSLADSSKELDSELGDIDSSGSFTELKEEINQAETKMDGLGDSAKSASSEVDSAMDSMSDSASGLGDELGDLGDKLDEVGDSAKLGNLMQASEVLSGAGEKVIEFGKSAMEMSADVESAVSKVTGYFGLTGESAEQMRTVVENVFKTGITDSLDTVADAVIVVNNNLQDLDPSTLEQIATQAINMEQVFGSDMNETMRGVNALMVNFGLDAQTAMDYLVTGTQNGLDKTQELGDNLSEYSGKFAQAGYSADEYFQLLNNGLEGGFYNLDKVNDAINEVTNRLSDGTIGDSIGIYSQKTQDLFTAWQNGGATQKQVIDSIVADIASTTNQQDALNMAATAFGTMAEDGGLKAITSLTSVGTAYDAVSGKAQELGESTTTPMQEMQAAINELKIALAPLGAQLAQLATEVLPVIVGAITSLVEGFLSLPGPVQTFLGVLAGVLALISTIAPIISAVMAIISAVGATVLLPLIGIIAGVTAAIAAIIAIIQNWGTIAAWFSGMWSALCTTIQSAWQTVSAAVMAAMQAFLSWVQSAWTSLVSAISFVMQSIHNTIVSVWNAILSNPIVQTIVTTVQSLFEALSSALSGIWDGIKSIAQGAWELIKTVVLAPVLLLIDLVTGDFEALKSDLGNIWENIKSAAQSIWEGIKTIISTIVETIKSVITTVWEGIKSIISSILNGIKSIVSSAWNGIKSAISSALSAIQSVIQSIWNAIKSFLSSTVNSIKDGAVNGFHALVDGIGSVLGKVTSVVRSGFQGAISFITSLPGQAVQWGKDFLQGFVNGVKSMISSIISAVKNVASTIRSYLHFTVPDVGPLADADEYGPDFMDLLADGMTKNIKSVKRAAEDAASAMNIPSYTAKLPYLSQGSIVPTGTTITNYSTVNNNGTDISQLVALMRQFMESNQNGNQHLTVKVNRKTLFDAMIEEGKLRQGQTGQNAFEL